MKAVLCAGQELVLPSLEVLKESLEEGGVGYHIPRLSLHTNCRIISEKSFFLSHLARKLKGFEVPSWKVWELYRAGKP